MKCLPHLNHPSDLEGILKHTQKQAIGLHYFEKSLFLLLPSSISKTLQVLHLSLNLIEPISAHFAEVR